MPSQGRGRGGARRRAAKPGKRQPGRPPAYTDELAERILGRIANGESLRSICLRKDMPARSTVMLWVVRDTGGFSSRYAEACTARAELWAEECVAIADGKGDPMRDRLRVDTRKWVAIHLLARKYGEKLEVTHRTIDDLLKDTEAATNGGADPGQS